MVKYSCMNERLSRELGNQESRLKPGETYDVENKELGIEIRERVTDEGLRIMRDVFSDLKDYTVFASTGIYLNFKDIGLENLQGRGIDLEQVKVPGDFDVNVYSREEFMRLRERLENVPNVRLKNDGQPKTLDTKAEVLDGHILMNVDTPTGPVMVKYPFEIFLESQIVRPELRQLTHTVRGLNTLTLEGLKKQYINNLSMESLVEKEAAPVITYLVEHQDELLPELRKYIADPEKFEASTYLREVSQRLRLTIDDLIHFYTLAELPEQERVEKASKTLAGIKSKSSKRRENIEMLGTLLKLEARTDRS